MHLLNSCRPPRPLPPGRLLVVISVKRMSRRWGHSTARRIRSIEKIQLIGTRTRDLPTCSMVHQPTTLPRAPSTSPSVSKIQSNFLTWHIFYFCLNTFRRRYKEASSKFDFFLFFLSNSATNLSQIAEEASTITFLIPVEWLYWMLCQKPLSINAFYQILQSPFSHRGNK
jgi:hypothetical protein